jgi:hypothetical protein
LSPAPPLTRISAQATGQPNGVPSTGVISIGLVF